MKLKTWHFIALVILLVLLPVFLRLMIVGEIPSGIDSYNHMLAAEKALEFPRNLDYASYKLPYLLNAYDILLAGLSRIAPALTIAFYLPALMSIISAILLYFTLVRLKIDKKLSLVSSIFFVVSPVFINLVLISSQEIFAFMLLIIIFFLISLNKNYSLIIAALLSLIFPFLGAANVIALLFSLYLYRRIDPSSLRLVNALFYGVLLISIFFYSLHYGNFINLRSFQNTPSAQEFFSDFGGMIGFGTFSIFLSLIGIKFSWKNKRKLWRFYLTALFLIVAFFFIDGFSVYINLAFAILSAYAAIKLFEMKWSLSQIKSVSMYLIVCGLIFSYVSHLNLLASSLPNQATVDSLSILGTNQDNPGFVLSNPSYGPWIAYYSRKKPFATSQFLSPPGENWTLKNTTMDIFLSRNLEHTTQKLQDLNIGYILISSDMTNGLIWKKPDEGLRFLFRNNETFRQISSSSDYEIWEFLKYGIY